MNNNLDVSQQFSDSDEVIELYEMTKEELNELETELSNLKQEYKNAMERLKIASDEGDIRENAAFDSAQQEVKVLGNSIAELEDRIKHTAVKEITLTEDIGIGSIVKLVVKENGKVIDDTIIQIVNKDITGYELNDSKTLKDVDKFKMIKVSVDTPVAKSMVGRIEGSFEMLGVNGVNRSYEFKMVR